MTYGLWRTNRHYMVGEFGPDHEADSVSQLEAIAMGHGWYAPKRALVARSDGDRWWPTHLLYKEGLRELGDEQAPKYYARRNGDWGWDTPHLGPRPTTR